MPKKLRNDAERREYIDDERHWVPVEWAPKDKPLVKIDRLNYGALTWYRVGVYESETTHMWDGEYHNGLSREVKKFNDHRVYYKKNRQGDAFIRVQKPDIVEAIKQADRLGGVA